MSDDITEREAEWVAALLGDLDRTGAPLTYYTSNDGAVVVVCTHPDVTARLIAVCDDAEEMYSFQTAAEA